ncbi:hypothetical protein ADN00_08980 [Ornatilinea apprima]|uniref:Uncharacterized protein n=1 Tax=Ornatilinea apprima TaxID=1134406 RepID=A0A0P6X5T4_9CHLR|nr:hypothetical protein [Ornatilinea apprima]KPL77262.1 hypothetical protein ADN00_08980 [Ornatilinea apprima]
MTNYLPHKLDDFAELLIQIAVFQMNTLFSLVIGEKACIEIGAERLSRKEQACPHDQLSLVDAGAMQRRNAPNIANLTKCSSGSWDPSV